jgi:hypothetical protein
MGMTMDESEAARGWISIVSAGLRQRRSEREIASDLLRIGVPAEQANNIAHDVRKAFRAGVLAAFTAGLSAPKGPPADPLLAEAFRLGHNEFRREARIALVRELAAPIGVLVLLLFAIVGWWRDWW